MMALTSKNLKKDIDKLIAKLIEKGVCDDSNFPSIRINGKIEEITFSSSKYISFSLKNDEYVNIYHQLASTRLYNMKMLDGALIQMMYRIRNHELLQHRLAFYPSPSLLPFPDNSDTYMREEIFLDIVQRRIIPFPLRFDFDIREGVPIDVIHPKSHLTLGDVEGCRIPVSAPLTPRWFIEFILQNFYQTEKYNFVADLPRHKIKLSTCITTNEKNIMHMVIPYR